MKEANRKEREEENPFDTAQIAEIENEKNKIDTSQWEVWYIYTYMHIYMPLDVYYTTYQLPHSISRLLNYVAFYFSFDYGILEILAEQQSNVYRYIECKRSRFDDVVK